MRSSADWPTTKVNILKLINRIFVVNSEAALYLYDKCSNFMLPGLFRQVLARRDLHCHEERDGRDSRDGHHMGKTLETGKYKYIILCDSHRNIIRHALLTTSTIMMSSRNGDGVGRGERLVEDFLRLGGL